ncbi:BON domain-containing protein [Segetibacter sp. 3557_3]|uniref:BON domain-containing protein n=1 Tax=Segetibacter sp. 3557_3 TaxID=2547429 RepID=UPI0014044D8D|nr:BON domain-containing protein [Segetibacter sp. 3557_3]
MLSSYSPLPSCSSADKDKTIKADLTTKAKTTTEFAGVVFRLENGTVILSGDCPKEKAKSTVESTVKQLYGVKGMVSNIQVAPVVLGTDQLLKLAVDSVLMKYASVEAVTRDSVVNLMGKVEDKELDKLTAEIQELRPKIIRSSLSVIQQQ